MKKQTVEFAITSKNGIVTHVGRASVAHPKTNFQRGNGVKWYQDKPKQTDKSM